MPDVVAKAMAVVTGLLLAATIAILVLGSRPPSGTRQIVAEFRDAFPALEGMQVRTDGAISGSVGPISVNKQGLAEITLLVDRSIPAPHSDASAEIRQADSTGDSYIAYDPGSAAQPLERVADKPTIACDAPAPTSPCLNTLATPRLDDLINSFGPPEQAGIKLILQSLSAAVADRGEDVNRAALDLVPALDAANHALVEVNSQNTALKRLIGEMEDVSGQAASKRTQLADLISALDQTLDATSANTGPLDAGLQELPAAEARLRTLFAHLNTTATATRPLASQLAAAAPGLSSLLDKAPGFLGDVRAALITGQPTLELTRKLLQAGGPTIAADPQRVVTGAFDLAPALSNLLKGVLGSKETIKALFGDDKNGAADSRPGFGFGFGAMSSEPGDQNGYPADWKQRNFVRFDAMLNCQSFGVTIAPGCLAGVLAAERAQQHQHAHAKARAPRRPTVPHVRVPAIKAPPVVQDVLHKTGSAIKHITDDAAKHVGHVVGSTPANDILDYLLG